MYSNVIISGNFRKSIIKVILAINLFFIFYLLLIALSIGLLFICGYISFYILIIRLGFLSLLIAGGLCVLGIMIFAFMIKFIFTRHKNENPYRTQIFEKDHPELFALIKEVSISVGTKFPRKVFLSHSVNAVVFYNSGFWSLFWPVRKNLEIGLGLINSLNIGELRAVLAHEFGHFSQKSMYLGSYVYTVNKVIYNLVYEYDNWDKTLEKWASTGGIFGSFAHVTFRLVNVVRLIMRQAYKIIIIPYMGLSREMEFHADQIAASVAGKENMISALRRLEFCDVAFNQSLQVLSQLVENKKKSENIYEVHSLENRRLGDYYDIKFKDGLPIITDEDIDINFVKPRVNYKDQWASHPSREERERNIQALEVQVDAINSAESWIVIDSPQMWQEKVTEKVYQINYGNAFEFENIKPEQYLAFIKSRQENYNLDEIFNGFYSNRHIFPVDLDNLSIQNIDGDIEENFNNIYCKETKLKFNRFQHLQQDLTTLYRIKSKEINTKYFDFDNNKYHRKKIKQVISILNKEIEELKGELSKIEENAILLNLTIVNKVSPEKKQNYLDDLRSLYNTQERFDKHQEHVEITGKYQILVYNKIRWTKDAIDDFNREISNFENKYRKRLVDIDIKSFDCESRQHGELLNAFLDHKVDFIKTFEFNIERFNHFISMIYRNHELISSQFLRQLKKITDYQKNVYEECVNLSK